MLKKILILLVLLSSIFSIESVFSNDTLRVVDLGTFNEYKFRITNEYLNFKSKFKVNGKIDETSARKMLEYAKAGLNYLPDSLTNKNYYTELQTSIEKGLKYPANSSNYEAISKNTEAFLTKTNIPVITGSVSAYPSTGNAPLTVTFRGDVKDPTGTNFENHNYTWWINDGGKRVVIGNKISLNYVFREEGNFSVFLDVTSNHKNSKGFTDVLPFSSREDVTIKEKIASVIVKVNSESLRQKEELKFTPDEARYGLLFDATSSTPTDGAKFTNTERDFGNGDIRKYTGSPRIERVIYNGEGDYLVKLKMKTNEGKTVERKFTVRIHDPIATIDSTNDEGYLGDKFTFTANNAAEDDNLTYNWKIIDILNDREIFTKNTKTFTYKFPEKGKYNVKLFVTDPSGETDLDYKIIYINSRAPEASLSYSKPFPHKPNTILLDASKSYDLDYSDDGKLDFNWVINGENVVLEKPNFNGSIGYYTFDSIGEQSVVLEVTDPDNITSKVTEKVKVDSILSVEFFAFPRVIQRDKTIKFVSDSPEAQFYEWNFGDGITKGGNKENISHSFKKTGIYNVKLRVVDGDDEENTFDKQVFVGESDEPYAKINIKNQQGNVGYKKGVCSGNDAYILNRIDSMTFSGEESIDVTGLNNNLTYSWKLQDSLYNSKNFNKRFDELGCFPVKLTVKSDTNGKESTEIIYVKVENIKPTFSSLYIKVQDYEQDPVIVNLSALGAEDVDGVIQSYLWYYYTDLDEEPQDFRSTRTPETSFVLPKISGNYYFVVVMKDNNEARVNSEDFNNAKYFITLTGDNVNTPIVALSVNNSSVSIGEEVIFNVNSENILGRKITKNISYKWDFDGDGFYDKETTTSAVGHTYNSSGEKHAKVKVNHKGFSNTKTYTVNVANILKPDFEYISVGSSVTLIDKSLGTNASYTWDMGDGNIIKDKKNFTYKYEDGKTTHLITLTLTEGTKIKKIIKKVVKDVGNFVKARKGGLVVFAHPEIENEEITIENEQEKVYLYLGASSGDIKNYVADYDIDYDSDLNGTDDDDADNVADKSYVNGEAILLELNNSYTQTVRVYLTDEAGKVISTKDIKIIKTYIDENSINLDEIIFDGVSESIKIKLDRLKEEVGNFPKEYKLKGLMYVQRLKEEWNDDTEKTRIIVEFIGFIEESEIPNSSEISDLLEGLLVDGKDDKSDKAIAYTALVNLIPKEIKCIEGSILAENETCYQSLVSKLDAIKINSNVDENRALGSQILGNIALDTNMTTKEKIDFKAILNTFVYGGVSDIPDEVVNEPVVEVEKEGGFMGFMIGLLKVIFIIILIFIGIILIFYIYYLAVNKDKKLSFTDFIIEKTSGKPSGKKEFNNEEELDILNDFPEEEPKDILASNENKIEKIVEKKNDDNNTLITKEEKFPKVETKEKIDILDSGDENVPDWLKGGLEKTEKKEDKKEEVKKELPKDKIIKEEKTTKVVEKVTEEKIEKKSEKNEELFDETDESVPDWLKGSFEKKDKREEIEKTEPKDQVVIKEKTEKVEVKKAETKTEEKIEKNEAKDEIIDETDESIPDWLKGSFGKTEKKEDKKEEIKKEVSKDEKSKKVEEKATEVKTDNKIKKAEKSEPKLETKEELDDFTKLDDPIEASDEDIPDWLKGSFEKEEEKEDKKEEIKQDVSKEAKITKVEKQVVTDKKEEIKKEIVTPVKKASQKTKKEEEKKTRTTKKISVKKQEEPKKQSTKKDEKNDDIKKEETVKSEANQNKDKLDETELWDDGMKVPDWLKTDDEK